MSSQLNIRLRNQHEYYESSLLISIIRHISHVPLGINTGEPPHLEIIGPFSRRQSRKKRFIRRFLGKRTIPAKLTLYHTEENTRFNAEQSDFSISSDLGVTDPNHFRMPNWWGSIDWSAFGVKNMPSPRIRRLINLDTLFQPLGANVFQRPRRVAIFTTHMTEPRGTLYRELSSVIEVDGYGKYFAPEIKNHNKSGILKEDVLSNYMFSLCPENGMYPGYYTEKVPESFSTGCIPITWADQNIAVDFKPGSYINLADYAQTGYGEGFKKRLHSKNIEDLASIPLLDKAPDFEGLLKFVEKIIDRALR
jgi:hypothetical protein